MKAKELIPVKKELAFITKIAVTIIVYFIALLLRLRAFIKKLEG